MLHVIIPTLVIPTCLGGVDMVPICLFDHVCLQWQELKHTGGLDSLTIIDGFSFLEWLLFATKDFKLVINYKPGNLVHSGPIPGTLHSNSVSKTVCFIVALLKTEQREKKKKLQWIRQETAVIFWIQTNRCSVPPQQSN